MRRPVRVVGLRTQRARVDRLVKLTLDLVDLGQGFLERHITTPDRHHSGSVRLRHRQCQSTGRQQLDPLQSEARDVHRVLGVEAVSFEQFGAVHATLAPGSDQPLLLRTHVADKARPCLTRDNCRRERSEGRSALRADEQALRWREEQEEHRRIPREGKP
jgi:hypothetical protein